MKKEDIEKALVQRATKAYAETYPKFFKMGRGDYAEHDKFLGVTTPKVHYVVRSVWRNLDPSVAAQLVHSEWHEARLTGLLILVAQFQRALDMGDEPTMRRLFDLYTSLHPHIDNWDLVDQTAYKIVGRYELLHPEETLMDRWIQPGHSLWQRRIAMIATWIQAHEGQYDRLVSRAEVLLHSHHDLLHKAAGWMLREMYKQDDAGRERLENFLSLHVSEMPAVMLNDATERMSAEERKLWRRRRRE